jgi:DNA-binding NarL/FixJ family response regulator
VENLNILVVDDHVIFREGVKALLEPMPGIGKVYHLGESKQVLPFLRNNAVDVVIMDERLPGMTGIDIVTEMKLHGLERPVVLLTAFHDRGVYESALRLGVGAVLLKGVDIETLYSSLRLVMAGQTIIDPHFSAFAQMEPAANQYDLSEREKEVASLLGLAKTNMEIAVALSISEGTVKNYISNILKKMGLSSRTQVALKVREENFL